MKQKTKKCPMETLATEVDNGRWRFDTGRYSWLWGGLGINLFVWVKGEGDERPQPVIYAKNLDHAVMFAQGFEGGYESARKEVRK